MSEPTAAPALDPHTPPMEMFERYPTGHEKEGHRVSRKQRCACGNEFYQGQLSPAWLDRMPPHQSKSFVDVATQIDQSGTVWLPKACKNCERRDLNSPAQRSINDAHPATAGKD